MHHDHVLVNVLSDLQISRDVTPIFVLSLQFQIWHGLWAAFLETWSRTWTEVMRKLKRVLDMLILGSVPKLRGHVIAD